MNHKLSRAGPALAAVLALTTCFPAAFAAVPTRFGPYLEDELGRSLRVDFDPATRFFVETGWAADAWQSDLQGSSGFVGTGWSVRHGCNPEDSDCWKSWHRFLEARVHPGRLDPAGRTMTSAQLFSGRYIAYLDRPYIVRPGTGGKLPVPFNFGFSVEVAGLDIPDHAVTPGYMVRVIDTRLLLDFWRSPSLKTAIQLGVGIRYDIWLADQGEKLSPEHKLAPFTATSLLLHHESRDGRHLWNLQLDANPNWSHLRGWSTSASAGARYQWIFMAINDQPISLFADAGLRHDTDHLDSHSPHSAFTLIAGFQGSLNLD